VRAVSLLALFPLFACLPARPRLPAPAPHQILEITYDHTLCLDRVCERVVTTIHRRGGAHRSFYTSERHDSTRLSGIDTATFLRAAEQLKGFGVFRERQAKRGNWLGTDSWTITVTTEQGQVVAVYSTPSREHLPFKRAWVRAVEQVLSGLRWHVPVG
jgi:hypothetical protein